MVGSITRSTDFVKRKIKYILRVLCLTAVKPYGTGLGMDWNRQDNFSLIFSIEVQSMRTSSSCWCNP